MKNIILLLVTVFTLAVSAQELKRHTVKPGETINEIATSHLVTPSDIYALNPDAENELKPNTVLLIPNFEIKNEVVKVEKKTLTDYETHKVKRKETLFSITKKYGISIEELKKANRELYSENLKKGDKIKIPQFKTVVSNQVLNNTLKKYTVLPKEGKWRIAYKFGITVAQLEALNPSIKPVIQPGDVLNVPNISITDEKPTEQSFSYYEVLPAEGFFRLKQKLGLTKDELEALNPNLKTDGLKLGMVLKIPANITESNTNNASKITNLNTKITDYSTKKIALLMPYKLNTIEVDSVNTTKSMIRDNRLLSMVLDFHIGVLMALDSAKQLGISSDLKVFDTSYNAKNTNIILEQNNFSDYDAVIGPMQNTAFDNVAKRLEKDSIPVIAAITKPKAIYTNVIQTIPNDKEMRNAMINFVKADTLKTKVVIIADQAHRAISNTLKQTFKNAQQIFSRTDKKTGKDDYFVYELDLKNVFPKGKTIVFLETENNAFASSVISMLNALNVSDTKIVLVTLNNNKAFEGKNIDNNNLSNLQFHFASVNKYLNEENTSGFVKNYKQNYGTMPSKFASRGFDITLDLLLRLAYKSNLFETTNRSLETEYIENKFRYTKTATKGYINDAFYILKYNDLKIINAN